MHSFHREIGSVPGRCLMIAICALSWMGLGQAQGQEIYKPKPIPTGPEVPTERQFQATIRKFEHNLLQASYGKSGISPGWQTQGERFMTAFLAEFEKESPQATPELTALGDELLKLGCNNPQIRYCLGVMADWRKDPAGVLEHHSAAITRLNSKSENDHLFFQALIHLEAAAKTLNQPEKLAQWRQAGLARLERIFAAQPLPPESEQVAFQCVKPNLINASDTELQRIQQTYLHSPQAKNNQTWLARMVEGTIEIQLAWRARGGGFANTVTPDGWKGFSDHQKQARLLLEEAWKTNPERPEAPAAMIYVSMGQSANSLLEMRQWFDRAVAARMDFSLAYSNLFWGLRPRWHGSQPAMNALALECLSTGRFDTKVPLFYLNNLCDMAEEYPGGQWRRSFILPGAAENIEKLLAGYEANPHAPWPQSQIRAQRALAADWLGNYAEAARLFAEIPKEIETDHLMIERAQQAGFAIRPRAVVEAEARAFTGPQAELLKRGQALELQGKNSEALSLFMRARMAMNADQGVRDYLRDHLALLMLQPNAEGYPYPFAEGQPILISAIMTDSMESVEWLLSNGANPEQPVFPGNRWTPLLYAVGNNKPQAVPRLLAAGAKVDAQTENGWSALHYAVNRGDETLVAQLLKAGANVNLPSTQNQTPLHLAVSRRYAKLVRCLIDGGANVNAADSARSTPLHYAIGRNDLVTAQLLLDKGAEVNAVDLRGRTALSIAKSGQNPAAVPFLLRHDAKDQGSEASGASGVAGTRPGFFNGKRGMYMPTRTGVGEMFVEGMTEDDFFIMLDDGTMFKSKEYDKMTPEQQQELRKQHPKRARPHIAPPPTAGKFAPPLPAEKKGP